MSDMLERLKNYYAAAKQGDFEWKDYYPNNMPINGKNGIYTCLWFEKNGKYELRKYTIEYRSRVDAEGLSHPDEGVRYYILHEFVGEYDEQYRMPEPSNEFDISSKKNGEFHAAEVNSFGRFLYVFDDEETARSAVKPIVLRAVYPYTYLLSDEDGDEWNRFIAESSAAEQ